MNAIIQAAQLTKTYPPPKGGAPLRAVDSIDFSVQQGEVFGFLGPNGAGKTTTIRMLTGLVRPTAGNVSIMGLDLFQNLAVIKKGIGVVPDKSNLYDELTAY
jgi:ABC-2 type transport system ATP-binding protein